MRRPNKITKDLPNTPNDAIGFFEAIGLAGLEGQWIRISSKLQRKHFGNVPFGRKAIKVEGAFVAAFWFLDFGNDWGGCEFMWSMADRAWIDSNGTHVDNFHNH